MIYLDMDNTLVNLNLGIHKALGRKGAMVTKPGTYDLNIIFGTPIDLTQYSSDWWANLPRTDWASDLVECVMAHFQPSDICVLSAINPLAPRSMTGKLLWLRDNYPFLAERVVLTTVPKEVCCHGLNDVLIDDYDLNNKHWKECGGFAITVPQPWNGLHGAPVIEHIEHEIKGYKTLIGSEHA